MLKAWAIVHLTAVFEMPWAAINASRKSMVLVVEQSLFIANTRTHLAAADAGCGRGQGAECPCPEGGNRRGVWGPPPEKFEKLGAKCLLLGTSYEFVTIYMKTKLLGFIIAQTSNKQYSSNYSHIAKNARSLRLAEAHPMHTWPVSTFFGTL